MARFCTHFEFFSSNRSQMLPPILSPRERGKYVENFGQHVLWHEFPRRRIMQRKQRVHNFIHTVYPACIHARFDVNRQAKFSKVFATTCHVHSKCSRSTNQRYVPPSTFYVSVSVPGLHRYYRNNPSNHYITVQPPQSFSKERKELL